MSLNNIRQPHIRSTANTLRLTIFVIAVLLSGCANEPAKPVVSQSRDAIVHTSFYPTKYFTKRIIGDRGEVHCLVPEGTDPKMWLPTDADLTALQQADLIVLNGAGYESWVEKVSLPSSRVLNSSAAFSSRLVHFDIGTGSRTRHRHANGAEHEHQGVDPHTWLDPQNAVTQADAICRRLSQQFSHDSALFERGFSALKTDLLALDEAFKQLPRGVKLLAAHPSYNYLRARYGWQIRSLDLDPGVSLSEQSLQSIQKVLAAHPARFMLWESEPLPENAATLLRECSMVSIEFSPCEFLSSTDRAAGQDYIAVMRRNIARLQAALEPESPGPQ